LFFFLGTDGQMMANPASTGNQLHGPAPITKLSSKALFFLGWEIFFFDIFSRLETH
jgi:hypothetical protein